MEKPQAPPTNTPTPSTVATTSSSKAKRGRKKKPITEFKIEKASEENPIVVKFE
jgi:hypothetical protein